MTTFEFYYLMLCMATFAVFAVSLAYSTMSWKSWKQAQGGNVTADRRGSEAKVQAKLAA